jgi:hypothetical protein
MLAEPARDHRILVAVDEGTERDGLFDGRRRGGLPNALGGDVADGQEPAMAYRPTSKR